MQPQPAANQAVLISGQIALGLVAASIFLLIVLPFLKWDLLGFNAPRPRRSLLITWVPLTYIVLLLGGAIFGGLPPAGTIAIVFANCVLVGFSEEAMFRGILFRGALGCMRLWPALLFTSVIFGLIHTLNVFSTGNLAVAVLQACAAFLSGMLYIAIRIRTQSIYPMMVIHMLWDFSLFMVAHASGPIDQKIEVTFSAIAVPGLIVLPLFAYGFWLLRGLGRDFGWMSDVVKREEEAKLAAGSATPV
nr:CPBP family intramembrane metalloprotease [Rhizobium halophytocola]